MFRERYRIIIFFLSKVNIGVHKPEYTSYLISFDVFPKQSVTN